jgi:hypothetical protein
MKHDLLESLRVAIQSEASRICRLYGLSFDLEINEVRGEEGYFKASAAAREQQRANKVPVSMELVRSLLATVEQNIEEKYQGLRLMLSPVVKKKPAVRRRKAS